MLTSLAAGATPRPGLLTTPRSAPEERVFYAPGSYIFKELVGQCQAAEILVKSNTSLV
jgi:hypothetical protein